jgi:DNA polymerase epsilon subunit 3
MPPKIIVPPVDNGPAAVQQRAHTTSMADFELPKTTLTKLAKGSVSWTLTRLKRITVNIR